MVGSAAKRSSKNGTCTVFAALEPTPMPRTNRPPSYRRHKARNCAVVTIDGRNHYLGRYGSPESHQEYSRLLAEWQRRGKHLLSDTPLNPPNHPPHVLLLSELILAFFRHVQTYYV